ncbi:S-layer homology domain-containing protein [Paenibacillus cisolokensis]|uniref:S-layer homology domain-containing protein n=1 Tax=Paenibacillus cisolokensis TaxID=1658519 RepID=UPI003D2D9E0B
MRRRCAWLSALLLAFTAAYPVSAGSASAQGIAGAEGKAETAADRAADQPNEEADGQSNGEQPNDDADDQESGDQQNGDADNEGGANDQANGENGQANEDRPESEEGGKSADDFQDLRQLPDDVKAKLSELIAAGVFQGVSVDKFGPERHVDRAQLAKVAALVFGLSVDKSLTKSSFADVPQGYALPYVEAIKAAGLTKGYGGDANRYNPSGLVTRQELAVFLVRGLGLEEDAGKAEPPEDATVSAWAGGYVAVALEKGLLSLKNDGSFRGNEPATRYELALAAYDARAIHQGGSASGKASIVEAKVIGAKKIGVVLNREVDTDKAKLTVELDGKEVSGKAKWADDKKSATIELDGKLVKGTYKVLLSGLEEGETGQAEAEFVAEDERLATLKFTTPSDIVSRGNVTVTFEASNQYGETSGWTSGSFRIVTSGADVSAVPLPGKQAFRLDTSRLAAGSTFSVALYQQPMTASTAPLGKVFTVGDAAFVFRVEAGELNFFGDETALNPGSRAYLTFSAYDQYGFRVTDPKQLDGQWGLTTIFSDPSVLAEKPSMAKFFDYDNDGYPDLSIEISPNVRATREVNLMLMPRLYGQPANVALPIGVPKLPASVEFDFDETLTVGDEDEFIPIIVKDAGGNELSPDDIIKAETAGLLQVLASSHLTVASNPPTRTDFGAASPITRQTAIQATGSDRGKIRIASVNEAGQAAVTVLLPQSGHNAALQLVIEDAKMKFPVSVELDGDADSLLFPGTERQVKFKILDQYGSQFNASTPGYKVMYELKRVGGDPGAMTTKGAAALSDANPIVLQEIANASGKGVTFVADTQKKGSYRLNVSLVQVDANGAVAGILATATAMAEVFSGQQSLTYEMDVDDTLFAAGRFYFEQGKTGSASNADYLFANKDVFAREIEISAKDGQGRKVVLPSGIVRMIAVSHPDLIGTDGTERIVGLSPGKTTVTVIFDGPEGARMLSQEVEVKYERPVAQQVKVDKSANVVEAAKLNGMMPWDGKLMGKISMKDQFGNSFENDKLLQYNELFGVAFMIGEIRHKPNVPVEKRDLLYIDANRIVYQPASGDASSFSITDFVLTAIMPDGKTYSTFVSVE